MLRLARQAKSALKSPFVCPSCRVLLVSGFGGLGPGISAARLPSAIAKICATRHHNFYSTESETHEPIQDVVTEAEAEPTKTKNLKEKKAKKEKKVNLKAQAAKEKKAQKSKERKERGAKNTPKRQALSLEDEEQTSAPAESPSKPEKKSKVEKVSGVAPKSKIQQKRATAKNAETAKIKLWKQTLDVLKEIKEGTTASIPTGITAGLADSTQGKKASTENGNEEQPQQDKLLAGALTVLKRVLGQEVGATQAAGSASGLAKKGFVKASLASIGVPHASSKASLTSIGVPYTVSKASQASKSAEEREDAGRKKIQPLAPKHLDDKTKKKRGSFTISSVNPDDLTLRAIAKPQPPVPGLAYGLDRVLFNPGVYHLQDPRSRVYNFDPYLGRIMPVSEFDFQAIKRYITSSKDSTLINIAAKSKKKYTGSTSSMTSTLAHFHYLLSSWRPINPEMMSRSFEPDSGNFTRIMRAPAATFLHWRNGTYAIDADKEFDTANILSMLGKSMEKLLTLPKEDFEKYRKRNSDQLTEEERNGPEAYHYTTLGDFMMRSQLDAFDPRVPGSGMFDLKTRAVISIRMDAQGYEKGMGYEIRRRHGQWQSFEREYYDMIRSAFLKYSLQVRMGRMDGIFVAFHNTERIFGFQYIPLPEMDLAIHGTADLSLGSREFKLSVHLLNKVLDKATKRFPERTLRLHFETREGDPPYMYIFAKPVTPEEIHDIQGASAARIEEFERKMMGLHGERNAELDESEEVVDEEASLDEIVDIPDRDDGETNLEVWEDAMHKVEDALENEALGLTAIRESIQEALLHSGLTGKHSNEETQRYVDALLSAMTSEAQSQAANRQALSDFNIVVEEDDVPAAEADESAVSEAETDGKSSESEVTGEAEEEGSDTLIEVKPSPKEHSLKDLIQRLASQVQAVRKGPRETTVSAETIKLREFERILSELIAKSETDIEGVSPAAEGLAAEGAVSPELAEDSPDAELEQAITVDESTEGVYGLILTVRNKVAGQYVDRPENLKESQSWEVEYAMEELDSERAEMIYRHVLARRKKTLDNDAENKDTQWNQMFRGKLAKYSKQGRRFRESETKAFRTRPVHVYGEDGPLVWSSVFDNQGNAKDAAEYEPWIPTRSVLAKYRHNTDKYAWLKALKKKHRALAEEAGDVTENAEEEEGEGIAVDEKTEDNFDEDVD
ncbi:mitochondrial protein Pet127-domain-containing protein [Cladorrhinum samala]|uniref:Mitochondrial protein Pet127-domain-containing protein n=1 Tax=Cladorrhinum samala TaxID=585594 RepID=A0AAV9HH26_9PEZI|nr:mitochondrial protein Pet127-domain-containing protein [Cladorrhinum samala]